MYSITCPLFRHLASILGSILKAKNFFFTTKDLVGLRYSLALVNVSSDASGAASSTGATLTKF